MLQPIQLTHVVLVVWCLMYSDWINKQDKEFIKEVHSNGPRESLKEAVYKPCTLEQLKQLDNKFINVAESQSRRENNE